MKFLIKNLILFYQRFFSPIFGKKCRFYPSCSEYTILAVEKYGVLKGILKSIFRILRCHPFNPGGVDFP
jgi:putative membrane protein insertion efficiency factor